MSWIRGFERLFQTREDGRVLALLRMGLAFGCFWNIQGMILGDLIDAVWMAPSDGGLQPLTRRSWLIRWVGNDPETVWSLIYVNFTACALLFIGFARTLPAIVMVVTFYALRSLQPPVTAGYDALLVNGLVFLIVSDCTRTWSVDCWLRNRTWSSRDLVRAWPRYLFAFQLVIMYVATGLKKGSYVWTPAGGYSALWYVLVEPSWRRFETADYLYWALPLTRIGTAVSWHWEQLSFILLIAGYYRFTKHRPGRIRAWFNRFDIRWPWLGIGAAMHAGIFMLTQVGPFGVITLGMYPSMFSPTELDGAWRRVRGWAASVRWLGPSASSEAAAPP
jgi:hypothetical protein